LRQTAAAGEVEFREAGQALQAVDVFQRGAAAQKQPLNVVESLQAVDLSELGAAGQDDTQQAG
jgi:hypothetical protein